jgi:hypothetical protein
MARLKIAILFGNKPDFNKYAFKYFILSLNKYQSVYEFQFPYIDRYYCPQDLHNPEEWVSIVEETIDNQKIECDYFISIIRNELREKFFAWPDKRGAIITTNHWQKYFAPPSLFEYLLSIIYYCLIYSKKKIATVTESDSPADIEFDVHKETIGCYADKAIDRKDNRIDVALGYFCDNHKEKVISFYGKQYYEDVISILEREWIGSLEKKNSIAYNLKHYFNFNIYKDSGFNKTFWENIRGKVYDVPGSLIFEIFKAIILAIIAALLFWVGLSSK